MIFHCIVVFACIQAARFFDLSTKDENKQSRCPTCINSDRCLPKYQVYTNHIACMLDSKGAKPIELSDLQKQNIVKYHNFVRGTIEPEALNMIQLEWDDELEMLASRWASQCVKQEMKPDEDLSHMFIPGRFAFGQNVGYGYANFKYTMDSWLREKENYNKYFGKELKVFNKSDPVYHYTQMIWASTVLIGCASSQCKDGNVYVCNYAPPGNVLPFKSPYKDGRPRGKDCGIRDSSGLCKCGGIVCQNGGVLNVTTCTCACPFDKITQLPTCTTRCDIDQSPKCGSLEEYRLVDCDRAYMSSICYHLCGFCPCINDRQQIQKCTPSIQNVTEETETETKKSPKSGIKLLNSLSREMWCCILLHSIICFLEKY